MDPKAHDLRIGSAISRLACLEKTLLSRAKQETSSTTMVELLPKEISSLHTFNPIERWDSNQSIYWTLCLWALSMGEEARTLFKYLSVGSTRRRRSGEGPHLGPLNEGERAHGARAAHPCCQGQAKSFRTTGAPSHRSSASFSEGGSQE